MVQGAQERRWIAARPSAVVAALASAGVAAAAADIEILRREGRFAARLPGDRLAWFPRGAASLARLDRERRVLRLIEAHDAFAAPRVLLEAPEGWDLRALVAGPCDPFAVYRRVLADPVFTRRLGARLGLILARQHALPTATLAAAMPQRPAWPIGVSYARRRLPKVTGDAALIARSLAALAAYDAGEAAVRERVLVHADFGFHNLVIDPVGGEVLGVFDFDGAALSDRCHDFKYLLFDADDETLLEAALAAYEPAAGVRLQRARIRMMNAASAVTFLAMRAGHGPQARPAGRTLDEDEAWTRLALDRAGL